MQFIRRIVPRGDKFVRREGWGREAKEKGRFVWGVQSWGTMESADTELSSQASRAKVRRTHMNQLSLQGTRTSLSLMFSPLRGFEL